MTTIVFRVDASRRIGTGHLIRCLRLARALRDAGCNVSFISAPLPIGLQQRLAAESFELITLTFGGRADEYLAALSDQPLPDDWTYRDARECATLLERMPPVEWLIVDHYGLDERWEMTAGNAVRRVLVIDDLANRRHRCSVLLDQNFYCDALSRYRALVRHDTQLLLGPRYALFADDLLNAAKGKRTITPSGDGSRAFVFFGGADETQQTLKFLRAAIDRPPMFSATVVTGAANARAEQVDRLCRQIEGFSHVHDLESLVTSMCAADFALGAGGVNALERVVLGLPSLVVIVAQNQWLSMRDLQSQNTIAIIDSDGSEMLRQAEQLRRDLARQRAMRTACIELVQDGLVGAAGVAKMLLSDLDAD